MSVSAQSSTGHHCPTMREHAGRSRSSGQHKNYALKIDDKAVRQPLRASQRASTAAQRVMWRHRAASISEKPLSEVSASDHGCAHCGHTPATISHVEAKTLSHQMPPARPRVFVRRTDLGDMTRRRLWTC